MNKEKMMKTAKGLDTFVKVMRVSTLIALIILVVATVILTVALKVDPNAVVATELNVVDINQVTIELAPEYTPDSRAVAKYTSLFALLGSVCGVIIWYALGQLRQILKPMVEGDPFQPSVSTNLRNIAYTSLALGVVENVANALDTIFAVKNYGLDKLVEGGQILSITPNFTLELGFLVMFFGLLLVSYIFRYGTELQQLSDETL